MGLATLLVGAALVVLPVLVLAYVSFNPYMMAPSAEAFSKFRLIHWKLVLGDRLTLRVFVRTDVYATIWALLITCVLLMYRAVNDAYWGTVATIGILMIGLSTAFVVVANLVGRRFRMSGR